MRKSLAAWILLLAAMLACNLLQPPTEIPPLVFPESAATYTPLPVGGLETPAPLVVTATPVTPAPTPANITLQKLARWNQPEANEAFWYPEGKRFGLVSPGELTVYNLDQLKKMWSSAPGSGKESLFQAVSLSPNGNFVINFNIGPAVYVFDADSGALSEKKRVIENCPSTDLLQSVYLSNGMKQLYTASQSVQANAPVKVYKWGLSPYGCELIGSVSGGRFAALLLSPDERFLVLSTSAGVTGQASVWEIKTGKQICTLDGAAAAFHRDGRLAVAEMQANELVYWRVDSCQVSSRLPWVGYSEPQALAFTPNGKYLFTYRHGLQVWDPTSGGLLLEQLIPEATEGGLLRLSPDGKTLITITNPGAPEALVDVWAIGDK